MSGDLLLTGATGFVGMEVLGRYLERTDRTIITPIRARDDAAAAQRMTDTLHGLFGERARLYEDRVEALAADLTAPRLGLSAARQAQVAGRVDQIIHSAASVSFALELEEARAINVAGTRRMLELAEMAQARGGLSRYAQISTAYVSGTHAGRFRECDLTVGQSFRNSYEQSKFESEQLVRDAGLPTTILRPSIVVGDRHSGWTNAFNVLYWPLRAFAMGVFKVFPAIPSAPVDVVSIDYVADGIYAVCESGEGIGETFHLTASRHASNVGEITELASAYFKKPKPRVLAPEEFAEYAKTLDEGSSAMLAQSAIYFPYFNIDTTFDNARSRALLEPAGITPSPLEGYLGRLLDFATRTRWGKRPLSRVESLALA
ncbi:MAG TPA: SDR family oxidoreductase [Solirubrobacteraceae bacterium]|nr:SDR family oxidoreductase [Solirubrobacteraceae bacterium]